MVMFFSKKAFLFTSLSYPNFCLFLGSCPNCSTTCSSYSTRNRCQAMIPPFQTLIQILYYTTAGGERKHANVRVVGWRAALLQRGQQAMDKERDIREARSDARVISSGPVQAQPTRGVLYHLTIGGRYLPFTLVLGVHARCISHPSPRWSRRCHEPKTLSLNQRSPSFPHNQPTCEIWI